MRGPPLIIFFFFFEYPKSQIKANGTIVATINVVIRVVTYIVRSPPASYPSKNWFTEEDKYLYIFVSIIGCVRGTAWALAVETYQSSTLEDDFSEHPNH